MIDESKLSPAEKQLYKSLKEVVDPEFGFSIVRSGLVDKIKVEGKKATVIYHLTVPFCPPVFALHIGREMKKKALDISGIEEAEVKVQNHILEEEINKALKE